MNGGFPSVQDSVISSLSTLGLWQLNKMLAILLTCLHGGWCLFILCPATNVTVFPPCFLLEKRVPFWNLPGEWLSCDFFLSDTFRKL